MRALSDFTIILTFGILAFITASAVLGIFVGGIKDPELESASWFLILTVLVVVILIIAVTQFPKIRV